MSHKHQLMQAMYSAGSLLRINYWHAVLYGKNIQLSQASHPHLLESAKTHVCDTVLVDGLQFKQSSVVFMHRDNEDKLLR